MQLCQTSGNIIVNKFVFGRRFETRNFFKKRYRDARVAPHIIKRPVPFRRLFV